MKKNKFLVLILIIFASLIMSGCSVNYKIHINYDGTINDSIVIEETKENFERIGFDMKSYVEDNFEINQKYHFYNDYYKQYIIQDDFARVSGEHSNWSLDDFNYSSLFIKSGFESISLINEDNIMILEAKGSKLDSLFNPNDSDASMEFKYDSIDLIITSDYNVIESNADEVNKLKNEFIWHFDKDNLDKDIYLKMNSKQTVGGQLIANIRNNFVGIVILLGVSIAVVILGIVFYKQYQKINEF